MFFDDDIKADRLPARTVCLTYDDGPGETEGGGDGPGPHTLELGRYLHAEGVRATFFVVGRHVEQFPETVRALHGRGHGLGNHTYSHPGLVAFTEAGGDLDAEIGRTDALLRAFVGDRRTFLRAPYGNWRQTVEEAPGVVRDRPESVVAERLNEGGRYPHLVGPVNWDIEAADWECWRLGVDPEECARRYVEAVERVGRGIVLMHDSSEDDAVRTRNGALRMARRLVPELKRRGYRFVGLHKIPQARTADLVRAQVVVATEDGRPVRLDPSGSDRLIPVPDSERRREALGVIPLGGHGVALRARNGMLLSAPEGGEGEVSADRSGPGRNETFSTEPVGGDRFRVRAANGSFWTVLDTEEGPRLGVSRRTALGAVFDIRPVHQPATAGR